MYGSDTLSFKLRGELSQNEYQPMERASKEETQDMAQNESTTPCGGRANDDAGTEGTEDQGFEMPEEVKDLLAWKAKVDAHGGIEAVLEAAKTLQANEDAQRSGAVERIQAIMPAYTDAVLDAMPTDQIVMLADQVGALAATAPAANYAANGFQRQEEPAGEGEPTFNAQGMRPFNFDD